MRTRVVGVAVAVVAAAAVVVALTGRSDVDDEPRRSLGPRVATGSCPEVSASERDFYELPAVLPGEPDTIRPGAARVWLCQGPGTPLDAPEDVLTAEVDGMAGIVNGLPLVDGPLDCAADGGPGYRLRFQYGDGTVADAVGQMYGCGLVQVGATRHQGTRDWIPAREFVRLLREQRDGMVPPSAPAQPSCQFDDQTVFGPVSPVGSVDEMVTAVLCEWDGRGIGGPPDHAAPIPAADLEVLLADREANRSDRQPTGRECRAGRQLSIQGLTAWGDRVVANGFCSVFQDVTTRPHDASPEYWRPGPQARAILDGLLTAGPASVAACPAGPDVPLDGAAPAAEPGRVPLGAGSVRLCLGPGLGFQEPADALVSDVDALARVLNGLEPLGGGGCTGERGIGYRFVFGYPDGAAMDVAGRLYGCSEVTVGGVALGGSQAPWDFFVAALRAQRTTATPPPRAALPTCRGPRGGQTQLLSPVALPEEMTRAAMCVLAPGTSTVTHRGRITKEDLQVLLEDRAANSDGVEPSEADCTGDPRVFVFRGTTVWGDRVEMSGSCGAVVDSGGLAPPGTTYWHPSRAAQAILDRIYDAAERLRATS